METVNIILTCYNRREKTEKCMKSLIEGNPHTKLHFIVVDDASTDGTDRAVKAIDPDTTVLYGDGSLFWNGGMHKGVGYCLSSMSDNQWYMLINDDVEFYSGVIDDMVEKCGDRVLVGATCDSNGNFSYGGIKYHNRGIKYDKIGPELKEVQCSTFNANCVLIPGKIFFEVGNIDPYYKHSMGDFDYGFKVSRKGYTVNVYDRYVGMCNDNPDTNTWQDTSLPRMQRIKLKESRKGLPFKDWFHYLNKNFGFATAVFRSITPYIKIMLGK